MKTATVWWAVIALVWGMIFTGAACGCAMFAPSNPVQNAEQAVYFLNLHACVDASANWAEYRNCERDVKALFNRTDGGP